MAEVCSTLLSADIIVTQNAQRAVLYNGALAIQAGRIIAVGAREQVAAAYKAEEELHLGASLIMPGLINAHTHASMSILRGFADDLPLMDWLHKHIFPIEQKLTRRMIEVGALVSCAEMLRTGTTAFSDTYLMEDAVYKAVDKAGLKAVVGEGIFAFPSVGYKDTADGFAKVRAQAAELAGHPRLRLAVAPHSVYTTTPEILAQCRDLAEELDAPLIMHLAETKAETANCLKAHGVRPVELCRQSGLLSPRLTIAHGVDLTEAEQDLLARHGVRVAHNPKSNLKLASGVAPVASLLSRGVRVALGTDGAASNNTLNMFSEMNACALLHKGVNLDPTLLPAQTALDMATLHGAEALLQKDALSGSLSSGAPADIIALDLSSPNLIPLHSPISHLVYAASGHETRLAMVNGRILYKDGLYTTLNLTDLRLEAQDIAVYMRKRIAE